MSMAEKGIWAEFFSIYQTMSFNVSMTSKCSVTFRERNCYVKLVEQYLEKQDRAKDTISSALGLWQDCRKKTAWNINVSYARSGNDLGSALLIPIFLLIYLAGVAKPNRRWRPGHRRMRSV